MWINNREKDKARDTLAEARCARLARLRLELVFFFVSAAFAPRGGFGLALFVARLFVMLVFARFFQDSRQLKLLFEAFQRTVKRLIGSHLNLRQPVSPPAIENCNA